jgi:type II secretory ATPase GspE/PulE/Tfp pilus assembly ATPase PilB-like protein
MQNWPLPPFFKEVGSHDEPEFAEAMVFTPGGGVRMGQLLGFDPEAATVRFKAKGEFLATNQRLATIKSVQLITPLVLVPDAELMRAYEQSGGQPVTPTARPFAVDFLDGEHLQGQTKGFVKSHHGLFVYLTTDAERVVRIFVPESALKSYRVGELLGQQLVNAEAVSTDAVDQALAEQTRRRQLQMDRHFGDYLPTQAAELVAEADRLPTYSPVRLGDILMDQGLVSREQLSTALGRLTQDKNSLMGDILVEMGALSRTRLTQAVGEQLNIPLVTLRDFAIDPTLVLLVPKAYAFAHHVLPLLLTDKTLVVAVESPLQADYLDQLREATHRNIVPVLANPEELSARIAVEYAHVQTQSHPITIEHEIEALSQQLSTDGAAEHHAYGARQVSDTDSVLVRLVNKMIEDAHKAGASDIHVEAYPEEQPTRIRFRIDGVLSDYLKLPHTLRAAMISRLKIMSNMDISEHRKPQDGKIDFSRFAPMKLELRVASLPTTNGLEDIVMRLLASSKPIPVDELGFSPALAESLKTMVHRSYGLILVCGPTGSGKTTTLHSLLAEVNTAENKIWTAEDPIEITHPGLRQIQMLPRAGLTFAIAMRAFLRADPDIIMVGEMRDAETTHIAIEASLTGHLVLSTLHTNSAPESVVRLLDMGLDPFSFSDALIGVLSQRLARRLCKHCKAPVDDASAQIASMAHEYCKGTNLQPDTVLADWQQRYAAPDGGSPLLYTAPGCDQCNHTGHKGRVGIYELMRATPSIKKLIQARAPVEQLFTCAVGEGMLTLTQYGFVKVLEGLTDQVSVRSACA